MVGFLSYLVIYSRRYKVYLPIQVRTAFSMERSRNLWRLWLSLVMLVFVAACTGSAPPAATLPVPRFVPTPNIAGTVEAAVNATAEAMPTATKLPTGTPSPTSTMRPTQDIGGAIAAAVQEALGTIPASTPIPTMIPTKSPTHIPDPPQVPTPTLTPSQSLASMLERIRPGVVRIETTTGTGTGVIFEKEANWGAAYILTNYHVIEESIVDSEPNISVTVNDSEEYRATVVGIDIKRDLAVLSICCQRFDVLAFGNAANVEIGQPVVTIGYALALMGAATATKGIVSAVRFDSDYDRWIVQTDAPINPGNSGGPLMSLTGKVLGINTYKQGGFFSEGIGFAVAGNTIQEQLLKLKAGGDALDAVNVLAQWTYGPETSNERPEIRVGKFPWVLEWTLEDEGTLLQISAREVYSSMSFDLVDTTVPGNGRVVVYEDGRYFFQINGEGRYTIYVKTSASVPIVTPTPIICSSGTENSTKAV